MKTRIMLNQLRPLKRIKFTRFISTTDCNMQQQTPCRKGGKLPEKLKRAQKLFQAKNNLPVFLKGGKKDKLLYYTTLGLSGLGLISCLTFFASYIID